MERRGGGKEGGVAEGERRDGEERRGGKEGGVGEGERRD